jgi:TonB-dependent SusC/RagA subfamily outer membrane receptor
MKTFKNISLIVLVLLLALIARDASAGNLTGKKKITITGTVKDITNQPVADAVIMIDGQKTSSTTDTKGNFKIKVKNKAEKIGIFISGSGIYEEAINGRNKIDFNISTKVSLKEVHVNNADTEEEINVGYGTVKRKNLTYRVSKTGALNKRYSSYNSIFDLMRGELSGQGVKVEPGNRIIIEGVSTFLGSTDPLFVVDGIITNSIDYIRPDMVKSVEVLKGASASVYGSRGTNGVILITLFSASDR